MSFRVSGIDAERISFGYGDELRMRPSKGGVSSWIAKVPGELHPGDFDLERCRISSGVTRRSPEMFGLDSEEGEEEREGKERKVLDPPRCFAFIAVWISPTAAEETDKQKQMREGEEAERDPKIAEEMQVERWTVRAGVRWERPCEHERRAERSHLLRISRSRVRLCAMLGSISMRLKIAAIRSGTDPVGKLPEGAFHRWLDEPLNCPKCEASYNLVVDYDQAVGRFFADESRKLVMLLKRLSLWGIGMIIA